jgi:hypothetical protein
MNRLNKAFSQPNKKPIKKGGKKKKLVLLQLRDKVVRKKHRKTLLRFSEHCEQVLSKYISLKIQKNEKTI